jgi:hypothetical protein
MLRRRSHGSALALSGAPSRAMRLLAMLRDAVKWPFLRMRTISYFLGVKELVISRHSGSRVGVGAIMRGMNAKY